MSYETFCNRVDRIAKRVGSEVRFSSEDGRHIAECSEGVTIIGNSECPNVFVKWGNGHTAFAMI